MKLTEVTWKFDYSSPAKPVMFLPVVTLHNKHVARRRDWTAESDCTA